MKILLSQVRVSGFGGDTMHMARLYDSSYARYSLEALTGVCATMRIVSLPHNLADTVWQELLPSSEHKRSMSTIFGYHRLKRDGEPAKAIIVPNVDEMQRNEL